MSALWSWVLAAVGISGLWIAAKRPRLGWTINILAQGLWLGYAINTRQWGFVATAVAYTVVYIRLLRNAPSASAVRQQRASNGGKSHAS